MPARFARCGGTPTSSRSAARCVQLHVYDAGHHANSVDERITHVELDARSFLGDTGAAASGRDLAPAFAPALGASGLLGCQTAVHGST